MASKVNINGITIQQPIKATYTEAVNEKKTCDIRLDATTPFDRDNFVLGNIISIEENGVTEFEGRIKNVARLESGGLKIYGMGQEHYEYSNTPVESVIGSLGTNGVWTSTDSATIFTELLNSAPNWTAGTVEAGITGHDFRISRDESLWNGLQNLLSDTGQYMNIDYDNQQIDILNSIGATDSFSFFEGQNISQPRFVIDEAEGLKVLVFGKGDGQFQITGSATDSSYSLGDPVLKITDPNIISESQANQRATIELNTIKESKKNYDFNVIIPDIDISLGDTGNINAPSASLNNEIIRIVEIEKGVEGIKPILMVEVTNSAYLRRLKKRDDKLIELEKEVRSFKTGKQDSGNTIHAGGLINANSSAPLVVDFIVDEKLVVDEVGNIRVTSFNFDYDVDPFRKGAGTATEDDISPSLTSSTETDFHAHSVSDIGHDHTQPSQTSGTTQVMSNEQTITDISESVGTSWALIDSINNISNFWIVYNYYSINIDSASGEDLFIRFDRNGSTVGQYKIGSNIQSGNFIANTFVFSSSANTSGDDWDMYLAVDSGSITTGAIEWYLNGLNRVHSHDVPSQFTLDDNSAIDENNENPNVSGAADFHNHNVSIGDSVSDASSVNATGISWELRYWDGSSFVLKNSGSESFPTGQTFNRGIDLSSGGTYPDNTGTWRLLVYTDSSSADLVKSNVTIKHNLNNN